MTDASIALPRKMERDDDCADFDSGAPELDDWLRRFAFVNLRANNAVTYVAISDGRVVGYYAIAVAAAERDVAPERLRQGRPSQIPCILLARLGVDSRMQGRGIGAALLRDALERAASLSNSVGAAAVLVHARDEVARDFYLANGDFLPSPLDGLQLMVPMKLLRALFHV
ncbi:MAG: GNAT family N-acetyltransferase [Dermatophilaceae bacterium]